VERRCSLLLKLVDILKIFKGVVDLSIARVNSHIVFTVKTICRLLESSGLHQMLVEICIELGYPSRKCLRTSRLVRTILVELSQYSTGLHLIARAVARREKLSREKLIEISRELERDIEWYAPQIEKLRKVLYRDYT